MEFTTYLEKIQLQEAACQSFWELHRRCGNADFEKNLSACYEAYTQGDEAFGAALKTFAEAEGVTPEQLNLYVFLRMSEKTLEGYLAKGIGEDVFYESMYSMTICCQVCFDRTGIYGIDQAIYRRWQRYVLDGTLFRLGRLEFQLKVLDEDIEIGTVKVPAGETVISVHIPRYLPLKEEDCEKSYACAREFFRRYYGMETCVFVCHSWLLHPWMQECLPETSAIIRFQKKFKLLRVEQNVDSAVSWIFPGYEGKPVSEYPADTSLRRAAIDRIRRGMPIGTAFGVRL